ncbi:MAG TPA: hypothetical protein VH853_22310 [Polyangia bacterium]|jgi:hypothetical protein|nr:hypothetical protein [Polyangia bacterium]
MDALSTARTRIAATGGAIAVALLTAGLPARAADADAPWSITSHAVERIAAAADHLYALGGGEVLTFDGEGHPLGRCAGFTAPPQAERRAPLGAPDAEEALRAAGLPDGDDSTPEAEDALEDEGLGLRRRARKQLDGGVIPRALASNGRSGGIWIATSSGLFLGDEDGCRPAGLDGRDLLLVAANGEAVVGATEDLLFRRAGDDAATFTVAAGLVERPRALALEADGAALVADDEGVLLFTGAGEAERILDRPTDALVVCGDAALALADDGVYRWTAGAAPVRTADRPPVRAIACGPAPGARWIATGLGVWTSPDGVTWTERTETLGSSVAGAATVGERTWLAIDNGLSAIDLTSVQSDRPRANRSFPIGAPAAPGFAPLRPPRLVAPALPWPQVTAMFGAQRTIDRHVWELMLLLTFPLERAAGRRVDPTLVAAERARRDGALAGEEIELSAARGDGERAARLDAVLNEREALR